MPVLSQQTSPLSRYPKPPAAGTGIKTQRKSTHFNMYDSSLAPVMPLPP